MIAVVTGAGGFIGRNLVERLLGDGHAVRALVRSDSRLTPEGCARFVVDYRSVASLQQTPAFDDADVVFHLAGATKAIRERDFHDANVMPTRHVLEALTARRLRPRVVFVSSQAAAGPALALDRPTEESDPARPIEAYGRSKLEAERIVQSFHDRLPATVVRPCSVFGPWDRDFSTLFRLARRGLLLYPGTRDHWLSLLHVDDVVDGMLRAATAPVAVGRTYFLASTEPVRWSAFGRELADAGGAGRVAEVNLPRALVASMSVVGEVAGRLFGTALLANRNKAALAEAPYWVCSSARAASEIGFLPRRSLPGAIRDTYLWYDANGWHGRRSGRGMRDTRRAAPVSGRVEP